MKRMAFLALAAVILGAAPAPASDPVGIYALIDKVVLEPKEGTPEHIQVWGVFVLARSYGREHTAPVRGYMYFTATQGKEEVCRREWADLQKIAGTGEVVAFGSSRDATGVIRKPAQAPKKETAAPLDAAKLRALIADLDNDKFSAREKATRELERQGAHAQAELRRALEGKVSAEARRRIEKLLKPLAPEKADSYPLGFGLTKLSGSHGEFWRNTLLALPEQASPTESSSIPAGKVTLRTKNVACSDHRNAGYIFEIEEAAGSKEVSPVVAAGAKDTEWSPHMEIQAGKRYTWRVRAVEGQWKGPVAEASFQGNAAR